MNGDCLKLEGAVKFDRRDNVLQRGDDALDGRDVLLLEGERRRQGWAMMVRPRAATSAC